MEYKDCYNGLRAAGHCCQYARKGGKRLLTFWKEAQTFFMYVPPLVVNRQKAEFGLFVAGSKLSGQLLPKLTTCGSQVNIPNRYRQPIKKEPVRASAISNGINHGP